MDTRNHILRLLDAVERDRLRPHFEDVPLTFKQVVYEQGQPYDFAYFPEHGIVSLVIVLDDGATVETGTVGNEGMVGLSAFLGSDQAPDQAICQIAGNAKRVAIDVLREDRKRGGQLAEVLFRYASAVMKMLAQTAACNRLHPVEERMSRWLLMTVDRVGTTDFPLTQEFLATMLGVRRPTVNIAGATLQKAGLIRYSRGKITVVDRHGLEAASCGCYVQIKNEFARALGEREASY